MFKKGATEMNQSSFNSCTKKLELKRAQGDRVRERLIAI